MDKVFKSFLLFQQLGEFFKGTFVELGCLRSQKLVEKIDILYHFCIYLYKLLLDMMVVEGPSKSLQSSVMMKGVSFEKRS